MQDEENSSLPRTARPVGEAMAVFCKRPATEPVEALFGAEPEAAILNAPATMLPFPRHPLRAAVSLIAIALAVGGSLLPIWRPAYAFIALALLSAAAAVGKPWLNYYRDKYMNRHELSRADLTKLAANAVQKRNINSAEVFRRLIGNGTLKAYSVSLGGEAKLLTDDQLRCFLADHGRILLVSEDRNRWMSIAARPLPDGEIWIDLGGRHSPHEFTAADLIKEKDEAVFQKRRNWIQAKAEERGIRTGALISGLAIIDAFRHPEIAGLPLKEAIPKVQAKCSGPASGETTIAQMHSGNYREFEIALQSLPLDEMP
jgi:hypothetical protein